MLLWLLLCYSDNYNLILLLPLERLLKFGMFDSLLIKHGFGKCLSATPTKRSQKIHWIDDHKNHMFSWHTRFDTIILADSIAAGLSHYSNVWKTFFKESLNLGIGGDTLSIFFGGWSFYLFQATSNTSSFTAVITILVRIVPVKLRIAFYALSYCSKKETLVSK